VRFAAKMFGHPRAVPCGVRGLGAGKGRVSLSTAAWSRRPRACATSKPSRSRSKARLIAVTHADASISDGGAKDRLGPFDARVRPDG